MRFRIGDLEIEIRKRDEESEEIKSILKDPDFDELLKQEEIIRGIRNFIRSKKGWVSEEEILDEFPHLGHKDLWDVPMFKGSLIRKREIERETKRSKGKIEKKDFFKYSESWTPLLILILLIGITVLNSSILIFRAFS